MCTIVVNVRFEPAVEVWNFMFLSYLMDDDHIAHPDDMSQILQEEMMPKFAAVVA